MGTRIPLNPAELKRREMKEKLEMSMAEIGLSVRTTNCLDEQGISTVGELLKCKRADLLNIPNFGEKTLEEVFNALERLGFIRIERRKNPESGAFVPGGTFVPETTSTKVETVDGESVER